MISVRTFWVTSANVQVFSSMDAAELPPQLTAATLARVGGRSKAQLKAWRHTTERHEQIALAVKTLASRDRMEKCLDEIGRKVSGTHDV